MYIILHEESEAADGVLTQSRGLGGSSGCLEECESDFSMELQLKIVRQRHAVALTIRRQCYHIADVY